MRNPEDELISIMKNAGVNLVSTLPCERVKNLLLKIHLEFEHIPLAREEAGVGISAGAALAGRRPAMIIQNSGIGNMINALLSLTSFYRLPLAIFLSHRGVYKEKIAAQVPMGKHVGSILKASGIGYTNVGKREELHKIITPLERVYRDNKIHAFLLSPRVWEGPGSRVRPSRMKDRRRWSGCKQVSGTGRRVITPALTRYEVIEKIAPYINNKLVICNLGFPAKELYSARHQPSNFYMLGSMGMATPIGLGVALSSNKDVFVIDGDGSILMNPGTLATIAVKKPKNLTVIVIDNGVYSSTGDQPTPTISVTNLTHVAAGFGLNNIFMASNSVEIDSALKSKKKGPKLIHIVAKQGNRDLPNIPLTAGEIKEDFVHSIRSL
jgi:sulfopyruvate decarboxylase beta subunit